ncbi:Lrp/AsnC family transcriptional regulator [Candidatus Micrarchaeota archaeon]|nr:Lrp/AsnC family transcriptional regulator [Candidatus Micrarchaeota archaeon]
MNKIKQGLENREAQINKIKLDELDSAILEELRGNCKKTWRELAKKLKVSPVTIINRTRKLEKNKVVTGYSALVDFVKIGFEFSAFQTLEIESSKFYEVMEKLVKMPETEAVYGVSGDFDAIVFFRARDRREFAQTVQKIYRIPGVKGSKTFFAYGLKENGAPYPEHEWF